MGEVDRCLMNHKRKQMFTNRRGEAGGIRRKDTCALSCTEIRCEVKQRWKEGR